MQVVCMELTAEGGMSLTIGSVGWLKSLGGQSEASSSFSFCSYLNLLSSSEWQWNCLKAVT